MATYKNTNGDYIITVANGAGNLIINAAFSMAGNTITLTANDSITINTAETTLNSNLNTTGNTVTFTSSDSVTINSPQTTLNGNLSVLGNATYINVQDITVGDPFITVAGNNTGNVATAFFQNQGLVTQTSATTFAGIRFNNANLTWQISPSVSSDGTAIGTYSNIATSSGSYLIAAPTNGGTFGSPTWSTQGIIARTASGTYAALRFNNTSVQWEISPGVGSDGTAISPYANIALSDGAYLLAAPTNIGTFVSPTWSKQGIIARTSENSYAGLRFNNDSAVWEVGTSVDSSGDGFYANIALSYGAYLIAAPTNDGVFSSPIWPAQGIISHTSANTYAGLRFRNNSSVWEISSNVTLDGTAIDPYANIATSSGAYLIAAPKNTGNINTAQWPEQGIITQTSANTYAGLRFNNINAQWEVSPNVGSDGTAISSYANVALSNGAYLIAAPTNGGTFGSPTWPKQGVIAQTSANTYAGLRFNNDSSQWEISSDISANGSPINDYANIAISSGAYLLAAVDNTGDINTAQWPEQGIITQTSANTYAGLRFDNSSLTWQISANVTSAGAAIDPYSTIAKISDIVPSAPQFALQFNVDNAFVGSSNLTFDYNIDQLALSGHQIFGNIANAPAAVANSVAIYHNAQGSGGTGLYVRTSDIKDELVSKSRAIVFGLIL